jgi:hypothetical protein
MLPTHFLDINFTDQTRWGSLIIFEIAVFTVLLINIIPGVATLFHRLFTLIHELGHAITTEMTGGTAKGIKVYRKPTDGAYGVSIRDGGNDYLIIPAGYLSTTLFSAGLILLSVLPYCASFTLVILGLVLILGTSGRGLSAFTRLLPLGFGILFIWVALQADLFWSMFLLFLVAVQGAFTALSDLSELKQIVRQDTEDKSTDDATKMASKFRRWPILGTPIFWVRSWTFFSLLILLFSIWFTWLRSIIVYFRIAQE